MAKLKTRVPKQHDTVTVKGRTGKFLVIGIDSINKTVEMRTTTTAPVAVLKDVPWTIISYAD
jgi:hypothetical protein